MPLYVIGRITRSFGIKGLVTVEPITHSVERYGKLRSVYVGADEHTAEKLDVEHIDRAQKGIRMKFRTISDRTGAEKLSGSLVFVDEQDAVRPPKGSYFIHEVIGCTVVFDGKPVGTVVDVYSRKQGLAQDVWIIEQKEGSKTRRLWLPAVPEYVREVRPEKRTIVVSKMTDLPIE